MTLSAKPAHERILFPVSQDVASYRGVEADYTSDLFRGPCPTKQTYDQVDDNRVCGNSFGFENFILLYTVFWPYPPTRTSANRPCCPHSFPLYFISFLFDGIILFLLSYMSVCVLAYVCTVFLLRPKEVWGGVSGPPELELWTTVSCLMCVLETEFGSSQTCF